MKLTGLLLILISLAGSVLATSVDAPEIDGQSLGSGLVLISGLLMVARGRSKK
jgi:hypothetical protein